MQPELRRVWVRLSVRTVDDGFAVAAESYDGRTVRVREPQSADRVGFVELGGGAASTVRVSAEVEALIGDVAGELAGTFRNGEMEPALAVFVEPPGGLEALRWDTIVQGAGPAWSAGVPLQFVVESRTDLDAPRRFSTPLHVLVVGDDALEVAQLLRADTTWMKRGMGRLDVELDSEFVAERYPRGVDVLICDSMDTAALDGVRSTLTIARREPNAAPVLPTSFSRSMISIDGVDPHPLVDVIEELSHDLPLHELVAVVGRYRPAADLALVSSPTAVHDLRVRDMILDTTLDVHALEVAGVPGGIDMRDVFRVELNNASFSQETKGMLPLGEQQLHVRSTAVRAGVVDPSGDFGGDFTIDMIDTSGGDIVLPSAEPGDRVVDITVRRDPNTPSVSANPLWDPFDPLGLLPGRRYAIRVGIGRRSSVSVVEGGVVSVDVLVPPSAGGTPLEFVLFAGDFTHDGARQASVVLPPDSYVLPVEFWVRTPAALGEASCRVGVYHRNNLIQTFLVTAEIVDDEQQASYGVRAVQDHAVRHDWTELDRLGRRRMSIVLNDTGDSHHVYVKGADEGSIDWRLNSDVQHELAGPARAVLEAAVRARGDDADDHLRKLAIAGERLAIRLDERVRAAGGEAEAQRIFQSLSDLSDEVVQVVRVDPHQGIPWNLLYDWFLPDDPESAPVCWGGDECAHRNYPDIDVVCVNGFWGVRLRIEELIGSVDEPPLQIHVPADGLAFDMAEGVENRSITELRRHLADNGEVRPITRTQSLLTRLWATKRTSLCAVVGHMKPDGTMACGTREGALSADDITRFRRKKGQRLPGTPPLLMLLVCDSGVLTPKYVSSVALSLTAAGAAGLVCTESVVWSNEIRDFGIGLADGLSEAVGRDLTDDPYPMAGAMQASRRKLVHNKAFGGFAFMAFGPATLQFVEAE